MEKRKCLTNRQISVIEDLFSGKKDDQDVLREHNVGRTVFNRWLNNAKFISEIERRVQWSELMLSRNKALASKKLVDLTESESAETARKACIDIINMTGVVDKSVVDADKEKSAEEMAPELAGQVLAAMAIAKRGGDAG